MMTFLPCFLFAVKRPKNRLFEAPFLAISFFSLSILLSPELEAELLQFRDQNPLVLAYGLPLPSQSDMPVDGRWISMFVYSVSNTLNTEGGAPDASDYLLMDGETTMLDMQFLRGWGERWAIGLHLPFIQHGAGELDGFIQNYHDALNLPGGGRPQAPRERLAFILRHQGAELLNLHEARSGVGDVGLLLAYQWLDNGEDKGALHAQLKLPTGNADDLTGTGGVDYANWLAVEHQLTTDWAIAGYIGFAVLGRGDILPTLQKRHAFFGGGGLAWSFSSRLLFKLQADIHSGLYKETRFRFLRNVLILNLGGSVRLTDRLALDIAVGEDIAVGASPDVSFNTALRFRW
jgi:hypothetical protein